MVRKEKSAKERGASKTAPAVADDDGPEFPAPQCKFRCNRSRMILSIRIALHHIGPPQINLRTSVNKIELDTLKARRKFKLCRTYPRGIECGVCPRLVALCQHDQKNESCRCVCIASAQMIA